MAAVSDLPTVHPFERAGLGTAPFRYVGSTDTAAGVDGMGLRRVGETADGHTVHTTPGGTCAYCGMAIVILCKVRSADGRRFHVGTDCIARVGEWDPRLAAAAKRAKLARNRARKAARDGARIAAALEALPAARANLEAQPHPSPRAAARGLTLADWVDFIFERGGTAGKLRACKAIEAARG